MKFFLLGPMEAVGPSGPVALPGAKPRTLLAALLLEHGRPVSADREIGRAHYGPAALDHD